MPAKDIDNTRPNLFHFIYPPYLPNMQSPTPIDDFWRRLLPAAAPAYKRLAIPVILLALAAAAIWPVTEKLAGNEEDSLLAALHLRAESLAWGLEGAVRYLGHGHSVFPLDDLLLETARQPGIAWLALVAPDGKILFDSNRELVGMELYSQNEMFALRPSPEMQGHLSPDDPNVYETWKIFNPSRLGRRSAAQNKPTQILFIALNASHIHQAVGAYLTQIRISAMLAILAALLALLLRHFLYKSRFSTTSLTNTLELTRHILSSFNGSILVINAQGQIILANPEADAMFAMPIKIGMPIEQLGGLNWKPMLKELDAHPIDRDCQLAWPNRAPINVNISAAAIRNGIGDIAGYLILLRNLQEIMQLRKKLEDARRQSEMGTLAAGLAHEIRNPLSSICGYATLLKERFPANSAEEITATLLVEEAQRLNNVLGNFLHIAKPLKLNREKVCLNEIVQRAVALIKPDALEKNIQIDLNLIDMPSMDLDQNRILQSVLNILINAIQALPQNGKIDIATSLIPPFSDLAPHEMRLFKNIACIRISDNGPGIPDEMQNKLFTPYATTRANGTGLGLPIAKQNIMAHDGLVTAASGKPSGATFTIYLPLFG